MREKGGGARSEERGWSKYNPLRSIPKRLTMLALGLTASRFDLYLAFVSWGPRFLCTFRKTREDPDQLNRGWSERRIQLNHLYQ
jgi:hypothetical protein